MRLLNLQEHRKYERASIGRFPAHADGTVDWRNIPKDLVLATGAHELAEIRSYIHEFMPASPIFVLSWGSLTLPSVEVERQHLDSHLQDMINAAELWVYAPEDGVLVESSFAGEVTVARVPD